MKITNLVLAFLVGIVMADDSFSAGISFSTMKSKAITHGELFEMMPGAMTPTHAPPGTFVELLVCAPLGPNDRVIFSGYFLEDRPIHVQIVRPPQPGQPPVNEEAIAVVTEHNWPLSGTAETVHINGSLAFGPGGKNNSTASDGWFGQTCETRKSVQ